MWNARADERARCYLMDRNGEGGLWSELDRAVMADTPTLIIGLGGTGADALINVKYQINHKMMCRPGQNKPGRIAYLCVDSDADTIRKTRVGEITFDGNEFFDIAESDPVMGAKIPKPYQRDWLGNGLPVMINRFGAGGVRQYGRLMLMLKAGRLAHEIEMTVNEIWSAGKEDGSGFDPANDRVNVFILAGISGGTGSGTFLDMAYLVRYVITKINNRHINMHGMAYLPDVNLCKVKTPEVRAYIPVNGYATLKELDFWMNPERGKNFRQQYTDSIIVDTGSAPFDICFLISPNGNTPEAYDDIMRTSGKFILNILTASTSQEFDFLTSGLSAVPNNVRKPYSGNYVYASMGMSERRTPNDQIVNYLADYVLKKVNTLLDNEPTEPEVRKYFSDVLGLDESHMQALFNEKIYALPYGNVTAFDDFKQAIRYYQHAEVLDTNHLEDELQLWADQCAAFYNQRKNEIVANRVLALSTEIEKLFVDQIRGPYYAHKMLYNDKAGAVDVLELIRKALDKVNSYMGTAQELYELKLKTAREAKERARRNRYVPLVTSAKYDNYIRAVFDAYDVLRYNAFARTLQQAYLTILEKATEYNNFTVEVFSDILSALTTVFANNADIITRVKKDGNNTSWNASNFDKIQPMIDKSIAEMETLGTIKDLVHEFLQMILENRNDWLREDGMPGNSFSKFISVKFGDIMKMSLEQHYRAID